MEMKGDQITGIVDDKKMETVSYKSGLMDMAFITSTYDQNLSDNIHLEPVSHE